MPTYRVIRKPDQVEVYRYSADSPIEWAQPPMPFADYDHIEVVPDEEPGPPPYEGSWRISRLAFLSRFTDAEAITFDLSSQGATVQAAGMRRYMTKVNAAEFIDLQRADTRAGVQALEAAGLLAAGRAAVILDTPPTDEELYRG